MSPQKQVVWCGGVEVVTVSNPENEIDSSAMPSVRDRVTESVAFLKEVMGTPHRFFGRAMRTPETGLGIRWAGAGKPTLQIIRGTCRFPCA